MAKAKPAKAVPAKVGRSTKYRDEYCDKLIDHMSEGLSFESFAGVVGVARRTIYDWEKAHPEFLEAKEIGLEKSRIFWEKLGIANILNESIANVGSKSLNSTIWIFNMKNRFAWRDRQPDEHDVVVNNITPKSDEELDQRIRELKEEIGEE